ncbi:hypothetical protein [Candidatus Nitrosocosmicus franklandus]|uniref:hypothetical protein n=1 Tax=Candidatus Nitrosocosmicus franklandianus TaxID=1798806 RepID=UPI001558451E|nr:hypothetical protein [Candidatus Nitrosocosmicus franklandus]
MNTRNRTPSKYVYYGLHLYFSGLSLRKASERLSQMYQTKSCHYLELDSKVPT